MFQEVSLPGHLFLMFLKERLESWLERIKSQANLNIRRKSEGGQTEFQSSWISSLVTSNVRQFTRGLEYLIATGNLINSGGLAMQQVKFFNRIFQLMNEILLKKKNDQNKTDLGFRVSGGLFFDSKRVKNTIFFLLMPIKNSFKIKILLRKPT